MTNALKPHFRIDAGIWICYVPKIRMVNGLIGWMHGGVGEGYTWEQAYASWEGAIRERATMALTAGLVTPPHPLHNA